MKQAFTVAGMTCQHCVRAVTEAVRELDPQASVEIDLAAATVSIDSAQPRDALAEAISEAGYEVRG
jgi:copper chaperone